MTDNKTIDINEILKLIPHRYPFLLVDRVIDFEVGKSITGIKNVTMNEPHFLGHFPSRPVMPGVLIVESMAQITAVLVAKSMDSVEDKEVFFMSIDNTKFRKIVEPGDQLILRASIIQNRGSVWKFEASAFVDDKLVSESIFTAMVKNKS